VTFLGCEASENEVTQSNNLAANPNLRMGDSRAGWVRFGLRMDFADSKGGHHGGTEFTEKALL